MTGRQFVMAGAGVVLTALFAAWMAHIVLPFVCEVTQ
jgi:hypothetical protein